MQTQRLEHSYKNKLKQEIKRFYLTTKSIKYFLATQHLRIVFLLWNSLSVVNFSKLLDLVICNCNLCEDCSFKHQLQNKSKLTLNLHMNKFSTMLKGQTTSTCTTRSAICYPCRGTVFVIESGVSCFQDDVFFKLLNNES